MLRITCFFVVASISFTALLAEQPIYISGWGEQGSGNGQFSGPQHIAIDVNGNIYVADRGNNRIQKFDRRGNYLDQWGTFGSGNGEFNDLNGIVLDSSGNVYAVDGGNHRIQQFDSAGQYLGKWGSEGTGNGQFESPVDIAVHPSGDVYVTDDGGSPARRVQYFTNTGTYLGQWGTTGTGNGEFKSLRGITVDDSGNVFTSEGGNNSRVQKFTNSGTYLDQWGGLGIGDGQFNEPRGITSLDARVYVADRSNRRIQVFTSNTIFLYEWSTDLSEIYGSQPEDVEVSSLGEIYAIVGTNRIQRWFDIDLLPDGQLVEFQDLTVYSDSIKGNALTINTNKNITVSNTTSIEEGGSLTLAGGTLSTQSLTNRGQLSLQSGVLSITGPGGIILGSGGQLSSLALGTNQTLDVTNQTTLNPLGSLTVTDGTFSSETLAIEGGIATVPELDGVSSVQINSGVLNLSGNTSPVRVTGTNLGVINVHGDSSLGDVSLFDGFDYQGTLDIGTHTLNLNSAGFSNLGVLTNINGGVLNSINGLNLGSGKNLEGTGTLNAKVAQAAGSTIVATGNLTLGNSAAFSGYYADGEMRIGEHTMTIHDRDKAVLGSLTTLGDSGSDGVLTAPNGILLEAGKTIVGQGEVNTPNDEIHNEGFVQGDGTGITFNDPVSGEGDYGGTVTFNGGFSPGDGPTTVELEDVSFTNNNVLTLDLGPSSEGNGFDVLTVSGEASLDGTIEAILNTGFTPVLWERYEILTSIDGVEGRFSAESFDDPGPYLGLKVHYGADSVDLVVMPALDGDFNVDGIVDYADLDQWYLYRGVNEMADANADGVSNGADFLAWQRNLGKSVAPLVVASMPVPEPSTDLLFSCICLGLLVRRP